MPILGIDVYEGDVANAPLQIGTARQNGVAFLFAKASEGDDHMDSAYKNIRTQVATAGGVLFGAYHFFRPGVDPIAQANFFLQTASIVSGDLRPMLDVEPENGVNPDPQAALACYNQIQSQLGIYPWLYSGADFSLNNLIGLFDAGPIWLARYIFSDPVAYYTANQSNNFYQTVPWPDMWQYTDKDVIQGEPAPLDGDLFLGSLADLQNFHIVP